MKRILMFAVFLTFYTPHTFCQHIEIDNTAPRLDVEGSIVDAHDGRIIQFGDTFYWYGTAYGDTNGFTVKNQYVCYSSDDLKDWKEEGPLLAEQPEGVYYRPHVIYNQKTNTYVLWYNWYPKLWEGRFGVAESTSPTGPFKIVNDDVQMFRSDVGLGDFGLFVDEDQTAYISYNTIQNHQVSIEKLSDDYRSSTQENGGIIAEHMEAGSQFKKDKYYYLLTDYTCCFCNYGSGARVYRSDDPLTGYSFMGNINRYPGNPIPAIHDGHLRGTRYATLRKSPETSEKIQLRFRTASTVGSFVISLFTGNRPENCGEVENPRVHPPITTPSFQIEYWTGTDWKSLQPVASKVASSALQETVTLQLPKTRTTELRIAVAETHPYESVYINELQLYKADDTFASIAFDAYLTGTEIQSSPIIPAQQTYVMQLNTTEGAKYIWMGDFWGSASDNIKGHDYQYWSDPLEFRADGSIQPLEWVDSWSVELE